MGRHSCTLKMECRDGKGLCSRSQDTRLKTLFLFVCLGIKGEKPGASDMLPKCSRDNSQPISSKVSNLKADVPIGTGLVAEFLLLWNCATFKARRDASEPTHGKRKELCPGHSTPDSETQHPDSPRSLPGAGLRLRLRLRSAPARA